MLSVQSDNTNFAQSDYDFNYNLPISKLIDATTNNCSNCNSTLLTEDRREGTTVCMHCGTVSSCLMFDQAEERFDSEFHRTSFENEFLTAQLGGTTIASLPQTSSPASMLFKSFRNNQNNLMNKKDKTIMSGIDQLNRICVNLQIADRITNKAKNIYSAFETSREKFARSKTKAIIVAIILLAYEEEGFTKSYMELVKQTKLAGGVAALRIAKGQVQKSLGSKFDRNSDVNVEEKVVAVLADKPQQLHQVLLASNKQNKSSKSSIKAPPKFKKPTISVFSHIENRLNTFAEELQISKEIKKDAHALISRLANSLESKRPASIALSCIIIAAERHGLKLSIKKTANACSVGESTIRKVVGVIKTNHLQNC